MNHCLRSQRTILYILGLLFIIGGLAVPLIAYGFIVINSDYNYPETICTYIGYTIEPYHCRGITLNGTNKIIGNYTGFVRFEYMLYNNTILYNQNDIICANSENDIIKFFNSHYHNDTTWNCWYKRSTPNIIGFTEPYTVNGKAMVSVGFVILFIFIGVIIINIIHANKKQGYHEINSSFY